MLKVKPRTLSVSPIFLNVGYRELVEVKRIDLVGFVSLKVLIQFGETYGSNWTNSDGDPERWI